MDFDSLDEALQVDCTGEVVVSWDGEPHAPTNIQVLNDTLLGLMVACELIWTGRLPSKGHMAYSQAHHYRLIRTFILNSMVGTADKWRTESGWRRVCADPNRGPLWSHWAVYGWKSFRKAVRDGIRDALSRATNPLAASADAGSFDIQDRPN